MHVVLYLMKYSRLFAGLLGESIRAVYRKWTKTSVISTLSPSLLSSLISFAISFFNHFIPTEKYSGQNNRNYGNHQFLWFKCLCFKF